MIVIFVSTNHTRTNQVDPIIKIEQTIHEKKY